MMSADYEVFLCHRGPEIKLNVVNVLHNMLCSKGIKSFVDYEMSEGTDVHPAILDAIKMSKVHIVFLTPHFASSKWCLNEVLEIMKLQRAAGTSSVPWKALVLPVFYDVEPSDVRYQPSGSAYNLANRIERSTPQERAQWSEALREISLIKGFIYDTKNMRLWEKLQEIASTVEAFLNKTLPHVFEPEWRNYFAGQINEVIKALDSSGSESKDVFSVGVYGPNKSMLADVLVDELGYGFEARCLLYNVMDRASHSDGVSVLIRKLYKDLAGRDHEQPLRRDARFHYFLQNKRCLVVLEDVGRDIQQIQPLLRILKEGLKKNSLLVFTSRFQHVLREKVKVDKLIRLSGSEENKRYSLLICYNKRDDAYPVFVSFIQETFCMLGLDVCLLSEDEFVSCSGNPVKAQVIICIISESSDVGYLKQTLANASTNDEAKVLYVNYGRHSTIDSTSSAGVCLNVNFQESTGQPHKMEYKHLVEEVLEMFKEGNEKSMDVADFPVGLLQRRKKIESRIVSRMSNNHGSVQYFGLWGAGGVGKTTTAQSIYDGMHKEFESSALILDTTAEVASSNLGLLHVQRKILVTLKPKGIVISEKTNADYAKKLLSSQLKGMSAFIVLDDFGTRSQIDALCCPLSSLAANSIVIITSRDRKILTYASIPEENIFCLEGLSEENSEWLFCWHAFMNPVPPAHLTEVSKEVIRACQGLPLSLKVLGSHLYGASDINAWKESLSSIKQDETDIFRILRVSLNSLKPSEKEAFLDICCFFIGREEDFVCAFVEGCYEMGTTILTTLKSQCLITLKSTIKDNPYDTGGEVRTIQVHDQLRDMGRYIIQKEEKNRAWDEKSSNDILKDARAVFGLRGLSARTDMHYPGEVASYNWFSHLRFFKPSYNSFSQLRFLEVEEAQEKGKMNERMTVYNPFANVRCDELRWLAWRLPQELPGGLCSKQFRVLLLSNNGIRRLPGSLSYLKVLELEGCANLECISTAIGTSMPLLRRLELTNCPRLKNLDSSIGRLTDLRSLAIKMCNSMWQLPKEMRNLPSLRELTLVSLQHITTLSLPANLRTLKLRKCDSLESVDAWLRNLEELELLNCRKLRKLRVFDGIVPDGDGCVELKDPPSLRELTLEDLTQMKTLSLPPNLRSVDGSLPKVKKLSLFGTSLVRLLIQKCYELVVDDGECLELKDLPSLRELNLDSLQHMKTLSLPPNLHTLGLVNCDSLDSVDASLPNLEELELWSCCRLKTFPVLGSFRSLVRLRIQYLDADECLELRDLLSLRELTLNSFQHMKALLLPPNLRTLRLEVCDSLESVDASLPNLEAFHLSTCPKLKKLPLLGSSLVRLEIWSCDGLALDDDECLDLKDLRSLPKLTLGSLFYMKTLTLPPNLRTLEIQACDGLVSVDASLPNLEKLLLRRCPKLKKLPVLGACSLVRLTIDECDGLVLDDDERLELKDLPSLRELDLTSLQHMKTLSLPPNLRMLTLKLCDSLESVDGSLPNLEEIFLFRCPKLKKLPVLGSSLVLLAIKNCNGLVVDDEECLELKDIASHSLAYTYIQLFKLKL